MGVEDDNRCGCRCRLAVDWRCTVHEDVGVGVVCVGGVYLCIDVVCRMVGVVSSVRVDIDVSVDVDDMCIDIYIYIYIAKWKNGETVN